MDFLDKIKNNTILVVPINVKQQILNRQEENKSLSKIKFMTLEELKKHYYFNNDKKTLLYIMNKFNIKLEIAKIYITNLYYIEDKIYKSDKLNFLNNLLKSLKKEKLISYNNLFKKYLKRYDVIVYGYEYKDSFYLNLFEEIKKITNLEIVSKENKESKKEMLEFSDVEEEISYVAEQIDNLYQRGVNLNDIALSNLDEDYRYHVETIFKFYSIPLKTISCNSIFKTIIAQRALQLVKQNMDFKTLIDSIKKEFTNIELINQIITILNKYTWYEDLVSNLFYLIKEDLENTQIKTKKLLSSVKEITLEEVENYKYIFILGFNNNIPKIYKDEDYLNDIEKEEIKLDSTKLKNKKEKQKITSLLSHDNVILTYSKKSSFSEYSHSTLVEDLNIPIKEAKENNFVYNNIYNKLLLASKTDYLIKYNENSKVISKLSQVIETKDYLSYDNSFKGISNEELSKLFKGELRLSYTSLNNYYQCSFKYLISSILKLDNKAQTFSMKIGNIFHNILALSFSNEFNFELEFTKELEKYSLEIKEEFFLKKLKKELVDTIDIIKQQNLNSTFNNYLYEEKFYLDKSRKTKVTFSGIIDKILIENKDNNNYISVIDYKTGTPNIDLSNNIYGLNMQLPIYIYLIKKSERYNNIKFVGFYLQKILNNELTISNKKTLHDLKIGNLKLIGYTSDQESLIEKMDIEYQNSKIIKGMSLTQKGLSPFSKIISEEQTSKLIDLVDIKIESAITNILSSSFDINPKVIGKTNLGCKYCKYNDICYKNDTNLVYLKEHKNLDFLGGDKLD